MTTDEFFELDRLPRRIAVIGLGAIGLELGQALARLGVEVTGFEPSGNLGGISDPEVQDCVAQAIAAEMRVVASTAEPEPGPKGAATVRWDGGSVEVDCVLAAMGRRADLDALALDLVGIAPGQDGRPGLDPATLCVPGTRIYFAGDVTGRRAVLHEAADEGRIAGYNAARAEDVAFRRRVPMTITFTDPQIARIGASWDDLADRRADVAVGSAAFTDSGRGRLARSAGGVVRIYAQKATAQLLGVAIAAPEAEHMAHLLARALEDGATLKDILRMPFYHPTHEEVLRAALRAALAETDVDTEALEEIRCKDTPVDAGPDCD